MQVEIKGMDLSTILGEQAGQMLIQTIEKTIKDYAEKQIIAKEYMSLTEAQKYVGVSPVTFNKWRTMGLKVIQVEGVQRVKKSDLDEFLSNYKF